MGGVWVRFFVRGGQCEDVHINKRGEVGGTTMSQRLNLVLALMIPVFMMVAPVHTYADSSLRV